MPALPATTAHLRVLRQCFQAKCVEGEVSAGGFEWQFSWAFDRGELLVEPSLGTCPDRGCLAAVSGAF